MHSANKLAPRDAHKTRAPLGKALGRQAMSHEYKVLHESPSVGEFIRLRKSIGWGETDFEQVKSGRADFNEGLDYKGPLGILIVGESTDSRIVISGSTSFISNQFQGQSNNFNLFLNALSWAVKEEALVSLNRPQLKGNIIYISDIHVSIIFYFAILIFPFSFFIIGIFAYRKRLSR